VDEEGDEAMRFNLKRVVGISAIPLLGGALAVGAVASSATAQAWQDTSLQVNDLHSTCTAPGPATIAPTPTQSGSTVIVTRASASDTLSVNWAMSKIPPGMTVSNSGGVVTVTGLKFQPAGMIQATLVVDDTSASGCATAWIVVFDQGAPPAPAGLVTDHYYSDTPGAITRSYPVGGVQFGATSTVTPNAGTTGILSPAPAYTFSYQGLPSGIVNNSVGRFTVAGSTAAPGTYGSVGVTAADQYGARTQSAFQLVVNAQPVYVPGNYGDMVNPFGNGFDVYQQHQYPGAIIAGWTATQADPATHFIRLPGTVPGAYKFEYAPSGVASGLCVSDPGGGWASDPMRDGLILTPSNNGPWQQFIPQPNGTLRNVATGLIVSPNGTGAQLRGTAAATPWGGSVYTWTDYAHLPG
jgi:hypothetical protein